MAKIIAFANQKGGVGKTTTTHNVGAALALSGKRVLLIDLDPQANLSDYCGYAGDENPSMTDLMYEVAVTAVVDPEKVKASIRTDKVNGVDYIPSDINLANADIFLANALSRETILKRIMAHPIMDKYDFILCDCLPSLGVLLLDALTAAHYMVIPAQPQKFALDGMQSLMNVYTQIRSTVNPGLQLLGVLPTFVDNTTVSRNGLQLLSERYGHNVFETSIHKSVEAAKSSETRRALCLTKCKLGEEYKSVASEILFICGKG